MLVRTLAVAVSLAAVVGATLAWVPSASATTSAPDRVAAPIIAGTEVGVPGGSCTVGAVLAAKGFRSQLEQYQRATRWVVLAKHCAPLQAPVQLDGATVGSVVWQSAESDLELAVVPPLACTRARAASGSCDPSVATFTPRASGRVFTRVDGVLARAAVTGTGRPDADPFCSSGAVSGVLCSWTPTGVPAGSGADSRHLAAARSTVGVGVAPGDAGGPVLSATNRLYGIISGSSTTTATSTTVMLYTPVQQMLTELFRYRLAPAS
ncbi:trypsin-like serine protease [Curtobacterium aurantiacum]|uniref:trypsin-like serine protease n=1 Tax=Curtobacterium aurantiacum TaxID=3236919 RepID=UPI001BE0F006|nr:trypsin-like serine protease [Curtobacterium flaccumfaciens]MBT1675709.1 trypsin-like serine protease [Curtobacterium flaccumfaciens pv. flaccumfaciens]